MFGNNIKTMLSDKFLPRRTQTSTTMYKIWILHPVVNTKFCKLFIDQDNEIPF